MKLLLASMMMMGTVAMAAPAMADDNASLQAQPTWYGGGWDHGGWGRHGRWGRHGGWHRGWCYEHPWRCHGGWNMTEAQ